MQCGFFLQYAYSFTGRFLHPIRVYSMYEKEGTKDKLEEYLGCPVIFNHDKLILIFNKSVLDLPIVTGNKEMLAIFEDYMNEIQMHESGQNNSLSRTVRRYLMLFNIYHRCMSMTWFEYHKSTDLLFCQKESHMGEYRFNLCNTDFHIIISF